MSGEKVVEQGAQRPGVETPELFGVEAAVHEQVLAGAERIRALGEAAEREARDPVNQPTINNWLEAMGNTDFKELAETPDAVTETAQMCAINAAHLAKLLAGDTYPGTKS